MTDMFYSIFKMPFRGKRMNADARAGFTVVTGATSGIGHAIAEGLASKSHNLLLLSRDVAKGQQIARELMIRYDIQCVFHQLDLTSFKDIKAVADNLAERGTPVNVLVNCASGIFEERKENAEGLEYTLALNHLGPVLLTLKLMPVLVRQRSARVINVAADPVMLNRQPPDAENLELHRGYSGIKAYMRSKNINVMMTYQMARYFGAKSVTFNAYHPGIVRTGLAKNLSLTKRALVRVASPFLLSPEQGADTGIWLASESALHSTTGQFFIKRRMSRSAECTYDRVLTEKIWNWTMQKLSMTEVVL